MAGGVETATGIAEAAMASGASPMSTTSSRPTNARPG